MEDDNRHPPHAPGPAAVVPTAERLQADPRFSGRGITIAFLDSGFTAHPDLFESGRVAAFHDVEDPTASLSPARAAHPWEWHGTQTSVVAAGDGTLSEGVYKGLASSARLVLIKVGREGSIHDEEIARAFEWLLANYEEFGVRIVNVSLGGDQDLPLPESRVNQLAEEAVSRGLVVVVAAGNSGCNTDHSSLPPASAPSVITVGGYHDWRAEDGHGFALYCSSFGRTADGLAKPELIAPAMEVAAPIPLGTPEYHAAETLSTLVSADEQELPALSSRLGDAADLPEGVRGGAPEAIRAAVDTRLKQRKIVAAHYQHVDGTSFAAPIVSSVVAQMLEANPALTPAGVKALLLSTAERIEGAPAERQGFGVVHARRAVEAAAEDGSKGHDPVTESQVSPRVENGRVIFLYHDDRARRVCLAGDFNGWDGQSARYERQPDGTWRVSIRAPAAGRYRYKLLIDGVHWRDDPANESRDVDPFGGFDSILTI